MTTPSRPRRRRCRRSARDAACEGARERRRRGSGSGQRADAARGGYVCATLGLVNRRCRLDAMRNRPYVKAARRKGGTAMRDPTVARAPRRARAGSGRRHGGFWWSGHYAVRLRMAMLPAWPSTCYASRVTQHRSSRTHRAPHRPAKHDEPRHGQEAAQSAQGRRRPAPSHRRAARGRGGRAEGGRARAERPRPRPRRRPRATRRSRTTPSTRPSPRPPRRRRRGGARRARPARGAARAGLHRAVRRAADVPARGAAPPAAHARGDARRSR